MPSLWRAEPDAGESEGERLLSHKIILEDGPFSYQVDWAKEPLVGEDGIPAVGDCIESFLRLLENIHPKEKIAAYIEEGIQYSGM